MGITNGMRPIHPGEVLREDFLGPIGIAANALAKALHVPAPRINDVVRERRGITADTALRLARYFGGDAQSWLNLQTIYELRVAEIASTKKINREVKARVADLAKDQRLSVARGQLIPDRLSHNYRSKNVALEAFSCATMPVLSEGDIDISRRK